MEDRGVGVGAHMHRDVDYVCYTPLTCDVSFWHHLLAAAINKREVRTSLNYDCISHLL